MQPSQILTLSKSFAKFAKLDPFRNVEHDIEEAIDYCSNYVELPNEKSLIDIPLEWFEISKMEQFPTKDLFKYEDVSSWMYIEPGELKRKSKNEKIKFLKQIRGIHAVSWLNDGIPAIVLVDFGKYTFIGDGRGRTNFAIGMDLKTVPVVLLVLKSEFEDRIKFKE
jgi:hypothetical protein